MPAWWLSTQPVFDSCSLTEMEPTTQGEVMEETAVGAGQAISPQPCVPCPAGPPFEKASPSRMDGGERLLPTVMADSPMTKHGGGGGEV